MSKRIRVIDSKEVQRLILSKPKGKEFSMFVELGDEILVLSHITVSNISRAFHWIDGHPHLQALEMKLKTLAKHERAEGYPDHQFVETKRAEEEIWRETAAWIAESRRFA